MILSDNYAHAGYYEVTLVATYNDKRLKNDLSDEMINTATTDAAKNPTPINEKFEILLIDPCWETSIVK
jgi:hypothetical protein